MGDQPEDPVALFVVLGFFWCVCVCFVFILNFIHQVENVRFRQKCGKDGLQRGGQAPKPSGLHPPKIKCQSRPIL